MTKRVSPATIYTAQFWLLCTSSFFFFSSFNMIIPELPQYLSSLGGAEFKGLIISLFALTAMLSRPFSGRIADKFGRVPVMLVGSTVCFTMGLLYPLLSSVSGFLFLRLVHGFSTGFTPTGQTAYLSDVIPAHRRGEAMGLLGTAGTVGMAAGPAIGGAIANRFSIDVLFYCSSLAALSSIAVLMGIKETLPSRERFNASLFRIRRSDLFDKRVLMPCLTMVLSVYAYGTMLTVMPDFGSHVGIRNKGLLFTFFTLASLTVRLVGGRASDRFGRRPVLLISLAMLVVSMIVLSKGQAPIHLMVGISLYGLAHGMTSPTLLAWATDLSDVNHKGRGLASLYIFMELGIGIGAFVSGYIFNLSHFNFALPFAACVLMSSLAFLYLLLGARTRFNPLRKDKSSQTTR